MRTALIGYTGFVGGNLHQQYTFTDVYNSKNFQDMVHQEYDLVVCAGVSAKKWVANAEPEKDWAAIAELVDVLTTVKAGTFVLISTIDVYPRPIDVDEDTVIDLAQCQPYGLNRLRLEKIVANNFAKVHVVRLPGLFGPGLRKNAIFDFINHNNEDKIHQDGVFQFYNVARLWQDLQVIMDNGLPLVNLSGAPIGIQAIADEVFHNGWTNTMPVPGPRYDYKSKYADLWASGGNGYQYGKEQVMQELAAFVATEKPTLL